MAQNRPHASCLPGLRNRRTSPLLPCTRRSGPLIGEAPMRARGARALPGANPTFSSDSSGACVYRPNGPTLCQPRATPWVIQGNGPSPKGAALKPGKRIRAAHFGAQPACTIKPRALPWADLGLARWAVVGLLGLVSALLPGRSAIAATPDFQSAVAPLIESSCVDCHDSDTKTKLNFESLGFDLSDADTFKAWEGVFDRVDKHEMPPPKKRQPKAAVRTTALDALRDSLHESSAARQAKEGRVPVRRLTRTEYEHTMRDLLGIHTSLARLLPAENDAAGFDTFSDAQGLSPVHIQAYLTAADRALDEVIQLGRKPRWRDKPFNLDYVNKPYIKMWFDRPLRNGGSTIKPEGDEVVTFEKRNHSMRSDHAGFRPAYPGLYRIEMTARGYQAKTPVTLALMKASDKAGGSELAGFYDLLPGQPRRISLTTYFTPDHYFYPIPMDDDVSHARDYGGIYAYGAKKYSGEGVALKDVTIRGPLVEEWPPQHTRDFFHGVGLRHRQVAEHELRRIWRPGGERIRLYQFQMSKPPLEHLEEMIERIAPRALRRPLREGEAKAFAALAKPALEAKRGFDQAARVAFRALFSSPQFLFHSAEPGPLNDHALASRLSYFLWKSAPDEELFLLAKEKKLSDPKTLAAQVDRMLGDPKSDRFVNDFLDQWIGLNRIDATTPDDKLYPEYDDILRQGMLAETRAFFRDLIAKNLPARNLVDSDFTFLNRRLAEHYKIPDVEGETFRRVKLPSWSPRGGLLTQASVLKITANGTTTTPVKRGNFVLSALLGRAISSPPPAVDPIEPDTRGATTIREILDKHRNIEKCAVCHRKIDPPGFALESFDPIGGYRTRYRSTEKGDQPVRKLRGRWVREYKLGLKVDASGRTEEGETFHDIREFKKLLLDHEPDIARNLLANLAAYATGGEIQFADRAELDRILDRLEPGDFTVRTMIHEIAQSRMFRNK